jgi:hypothetical protein
VFCCRSKRLISKLIQTGSGVVKIDANHLQVPAKGNLGESWVRWMRVLRASRPVEGVRVGSPHPRALVLLCQMLNPLQMITVHSRACQVTQCREKTPR